MKAEKRKVCGESLIVQVYGGGHRFACPACDRATWAGPHVLSFTNAAPPEDRKCRKTK